MRRDDIAWAAGLFEGEGYVGVRRQKGRKNPNAQIIMSSTDEDVLRRFVAIVGAGKVYGPYTYSNPKWKPYWQWQAQTYELVQHVVALLWPWLCTRRRAQAAEALVTLRAA